MKQDREPRTFIPLRNFTKRRRRRPGPWQKMTKVDRVNWLRLNDVKVLVRNRGGLPDTSEGHAQLRMMLDLGLDGHEARKMARWMPYGELDEIIEDIDRNRPRCWTAKEIGLLMRLTFDDKVRLNLRMIHCYDKQDYEVAAFYADRKRDREAERQRRRRIREGKAPRQEYEAKSVTKAKPWVAMGISRATWYRLKAAGCETDLRPTNVVVFPCETSPYAHESLPGERTHLSHALVAEGEKPRASANRPRGSETFKATPPHNGAPVAGAGPRRVETRPTVPPQRERVLALLRTKARGTDITTIERVAGIPRRTAYVLLHHMHRNGDVSRIGPGMYGLPRAESWWQADRSQRLMSS